MAALATTRRALLGGLAAAPLLTVPALAVPTGATPFAVAHARYISVRDALNNSPDDWELTNPAAFDAMEKRYSAAQDAVDEATPTNWHEFVQKLEASIADGVTPGADLCNQLIAEAKRLLG